MTRRVRWAVAGAVVLALVIGALVTPWRQVSDRIASGPRVGNLVARTTHPAELSTPFAPSTWIVSGDEVSALATRLAASGLTADAERVRATRSDHLLVTVVYDACAKDDPVLRLDGHELRVTWNHHENRNCEVAVTTHAVFTVDMADLPAGTTTLTCRPGHAITWSQGRVTGEPCQGFIT